MATKGRFFLNYVKLSKHSGEAMHAKLTSGHSIWLIPATPELDKLQPLITELSEMAGTDHFSPHITLLGQLNNPREFLIDGIGEICRQTQSFSLKLSQVGMFDSYYRSVILHTQPSHDLDQLHKAAVQLFRVNTKAPFLPHLSVMYGDLPLVQREELMGRVHLDLPISLQVKEMVLMETRGRSHDWREIERFSLRLVKKEPR